MKTDRMESAARRPRLATSDGPGRSGRWERAAGGFQLAALALLASCTTSAPASVTLVEDGGTTPTIAVDPESGGSYVAWVSASDSAGDVYLARNGPDGQLLGEPVRVNAAPGDASTHEQAPPQVEVGPGGEVYVVWQKSYPVEGRTYDASDLRFARSTDGGRSFGPTMTVNDDAGGPPSSHTFHDVAVAGDGTVYVGWLDSRETDRARAALAAAGPAGGAQGGGHEHGAAAGLPGSEIRVASWSPGDSAFGPSVVIDGGVCPCCRASLAVGGDGTVYVAWRKIHEGNVRDVVLARSTDGGRSFSAPRPVHRDGWVFEGCPHAGPSVALDAAGRVHVAWYTGVEGGQGLYYAVSADRGDRFSTPHPLLADEWVPPSQVKLAPTTEGVWAAWEDRRAEARVTHLARLGDDGAREVGDPLAGHSPSLASAAGVTAVVWQEGGAVRVRAYPGE